MNFAASVNNLITDLPFTGVQAKPAYGDIDATHARSSNDRIGRTIITAMDC